MLSANTLPLQKATALTHAFIARLVQPRDTFAHKGSFGHALLIAGNTGKMGAALLATKACLRSGVGLVTVQALADTFTIVQVAIPEAMCIARDAEIAFEKYAVIGIGPGLGTDTMSSELVNKVLKKSKQPLAIDADALNIIAANHLLGYIPANAIITPHAIEFDRLFGNHHNDGERWLTAIEASTKYPFVIVLKGHHTLITQHGKAWYNTTGNAGMAKGGSGDVLTGIITALLAQRYSMMHAALLGVYLHGLAGDLTLANEAIESMLPSDLIAHIGKAYLHLRS
jgi:NAD(P)H-hydrate epimerase